MKNAETTAVKDSSVATAQAVTYSISQAAKRLKRSESMTKKYKATLLSAWVIHTELVVNKVGSLTQQGLDELSVVQRHYASGNPDGYAVDLHNRHRDLFSDLASDQGNGQVIDAEIEDEDFIPDGSETREETAITLNNQSKQMAQAETLFNKHIAMAQGRFYANIRAAFDPIAAKALEDSMRQAAEVVEGLGKPQGDPAKPSNA